MSASRPPAQCPRLYDYFTCHDLMPPSLHGAIEAMAQAGVSVRGQPDPDGRLINGGAVGFVQRNPFDSMLRHNDETQLVERVSRAQKHRETRALVDSLPPAIKQTLWLAYGPQDLVPGLKLGDNAQARKRLDEGTSTLYDEVQNRSRAKSHEKRFGSWRQVLPMTRTAVRAYVEYLEQTSKAAHELSLVHWLVNIAKPSVIAAAQAEANERVREAWNAWLDVSQSRRVRTPYVRQEQAKPWS